MVSHICTDVGFVIKVLIDRLVLVIGVPFCSSEDSAEDPISRILCPSVFLCFSVCACVHACTCVDIARKRRTTSVAAAAYSERFERN